MKKSEYSIAYILRYAADNFLAENQQDYLTSDNKSKYSCVAVDLAMSKLGLHSEELSIQISKGLENMGLDTGAIRKFGDASNNYELTEETQAARYNWLYFAALIAEEQGV
jgi:hypothetical protein